MMALLQGLKIYIFTRIPGGSQTKHGITWIYKARIVWNAAAGRD
jgi:hypothetical protein